VNESLASHAHDGFPSEADLARVEQLAGGSLQTPACIERTLDALPYDHDYRNAYSVKSVRRALHSDRITCIDAAVLAYGLLDFFPETRRQLLAIHRRGPDGEECGHVVALYWAADDRVGALSRSSFTQLGHRRPLHDDPHEVAMTYAVEYLNVGLSPLYYGFTTLEEVCPDFDWRTDPRPMNFLSSRIQDHYAFRFDIRSDRS
jgi:hypothetical protein